MEMRQTDRFALLHCRAGPSKAAVSPKSQACYPHPLDHPPLTKDRQPWIS